MSLVEILKTKTEEYLKNYDYKNASFFAEKILAISKSKTIFFKKKRFKGRIRQIHKFINRMLLPL
jgi:hypothetical protein